MHGQPLATSGSSSSGDRVRPPSERSSAAAEIEAETMGARFAQEVSSAPSTDAPWPAWITEPLRSIPRRAPGVHPILDRAGAGWPLSGPGLEAPVEQVRVHADARSARWSSMISADAFTVGNHVFLGSHSRSDRRAFLGVLGHELVHVAQQAKTGPVLQRRSREPEIAEKLGGWASREDAADALALLESMSHEDFNDTLAEMYRTRSVTFLMKRLPTEAHRHRFLQLVGARATQANKEGLFAAEPRLNVSVEPHLIVFGQRLRSEYGPSGPRASTALDGLASTDPKAPFSGVATRGDTAREAPISFKEMATLGLQAKRADALPKSEPDPKYTRTHGIEMFYDWSNPIKGSLVGPGSWLDKLPTEQRQDQARLLFQREIATDSPGAYPGGLPMRVQVIRAAARAHRLHPELVAAFILAEQRDQSEHEDAAEYKKATVAKKASASIGLGQVTVKTAKQHRLFADLLAPSLQDALSEKTDKGTLEVAQLLAAEEELNIFAVARYIRIVADIGAKMDIMGPELDTAVEWLGELDLSVYEQSSSGWSDDHIRLLGSEYTSKPFDGELTPDWGEFVFEAYRDVVYAKIF